MYSPVQLLWISSLPWLFHSRYFNGNCFKLWLKLQWVLLGWERNTKTLGMHMYFCGFSFFPFGVWFWPQPHPKWKENSDRGAVGNCILIKCTISGVGGRPFCPAHNRTSSRSTRDTIILSGGEQAANAWTLTKRNAIGMKGVVRKGEWWRVKWRHGATGNKGCAN